MPRPKKSRSAAPPGLREDADQLAAEAAAAAGGAPAAETPPASGRKRRGGAAKPAPDGAGPGAVAPPPIGGEVVFPLEAIAAVHLELWNGVAKRLRSRWGLSPEGAREMAVYAEICIRQYLGPMMAEHAALAGYLVTQSAALLALLALREPPPEKKPAPLPESGVARAAAAGAAG